MGTSVSVPDVAAMAGWRGPSPKPKKAGPQEPEPRSPQGAAFTRRPLQID